MVLSLRKFPLVLTYKYEGYMSFHGFDEGNHHGSQGSGSREWRRSHAVILHSAWRGSVLFHGLEPAWHLAWHGGLPKGRGGKAPSPPPRARSCVCALAAPAIQHHRPSSAAANPRLFRVSPVHL